MVTAAQSAVSEREIRVVTATAQGMVNERMARAADTWQSYSILSHCEERGVALIRSSEGDEYEVNLTMFTCSCPDMLRCAAMNARLIALGFDGGVTCKHIFVTSLLIAEAERVGAEEFGDVDDNAGEYAWMEAGKL